MESIVQLLLMRFIPALTALILAGAAIASAEESNGYVFVGAAKPSGNPFTRYQNTFAHLGGGGEVALGRWMGFGVEIGVLIPSGSGSQAVGLGSLGPYFHFLTSDSKIDPFVAGGYSAQFRGGVSNLWHAGGGVNYWLRDRLGIRAEFRDHVWVDRNNLQLVDFRFGIVLK